MRTLILAAVIGAIVTVLAPAPDVLARTGIAASDAPVLIPTHLDGQASLIPARSHHHRRHHHHRTHTAA